MNAPTMDKADTQNSDITDEELRQAVDIAKGIREVAAAAKNYKAGEYSLGFTVSKEGEVVFTVTRKGWL